MKNLKRILIAAAAALLLLSLSACGAKQDDKTIRVGASPAPHAQILKAAEPLLKEKGYTLVIQEFSDYVLPNNALEEGSLDANFFQHEPYLLDFNQENGTHLVAVANIHYEPMGVYAGKSASLDSIPSGAQIAVPSDTTNEARALQLLEKIGLIKLKEGAGLTATKNDIADNPHQIRIVETEAAQVPRTPAGRGFCRRQRQLRHIRRRHRQGTGQGGLLHKIRQHRRREGGTGIFREDHGPGGSSDLRHGTPVHRR